MPAAVWFLAGLCTGVWLGKKWYYLVPEKMKWPLSGKEAGRLIEYLAQELETMRE